MGTKPDQAAWGFSVPGKLYEKWPKDPSGNPEAPVYLTHCSGLNLDDAMLISALDSCGIPALRQYPGDGDFGRLILGVSGNGVDIFVPSPMWEEACALLRAREESTFDDD
ncbi:MAG: hypothetical protein Q4A39_00670 [Eubacteriales bacterium]|nr:hypothetical protein [Eubacteriales bacterium]